MRPSPETLRKLQRSARERGTTAARLKFESALLDAADALLDVLDAAVESVEAGQASAELTTAVGGFPRTPSSQRKNQEFLFGPEGEGSKTRKQGVNPRALGVSPRQLGVNPRRLGTSPRQRAGEAEKKVRTVDRKKVTDAEYNVAVLILAEFNVRAKTRFASGDWIAKVIMRIREHPDLTLADHARIIELNLAAPWWKGAATPSVIYGSGAQFERSMLCDGRREPSSRAERKQERIRSLMT